MKIEQYSAETESVNHALHTCIRIKDLSCIINATSSRLKIKDMHHMVVGPKDKVKQAVVGAWCRGTYPGILGPISGSSSL